MHTKSEKTGRNLPSATVAERYGITRRTLARWMVDPKMGFPQSITLNGRHYFVEAEIEAYERGLAAARGRAA